MNSSFRRIGDWAHLARLELSEREQSLLESELPRIVEFMGDLGRPESPDTDGESAVDRRTEPGTVDPTEGGSGLEREDEVRASLEPAEALREAGSSEDGYFIVPTVIETEGARKTRIDREEA